MGSDQSKQSDDKRSSSARRQNFRPQSPPTRSPRPMPTYQQSQRPTPTHTEPETRLQQPYSYTQEELVTASSALYPRLDHVITPLSPNQSPSQQNRQGTSNPARAEDAGQRGAYSAPTVQAASCSASPAQKPANFAPTVQAPAYFSPTAQSAAYSSPNAQAANTSSAAQKPTLTAPDHHSATCTTRRSPNTASNEGFVVINLPKSASEPEVVIRPTAPPQGFENSHKKQVARKPRSRSRGAAAAAGEININCPTCDGQYTENIFQCGTGHSACERCKQHGVRCRLCRQPISDMRNFSFQEYVCEDEQMFAYRNSFRQYCVPIVHIRQCLCDSRLWWNSVYTRENKFQCGMGQYVCGGCKGQGRLSIRDNVQLQACTCEIKTPCYNADEGCMLSFKIGDMGRHLRDCPFQEMDCPLKTIYGRCSWRGKMSQLVSHFDACHPESRQGNIDQEMLLPNVYYNDKYVHLVELGCYKFLLHLKVSEADRRVYITVQLIGTKNSASNWTYDIHVYNKREPRRKYQFSDTCHPIGTSVEKIFNEAKCAVLPLPFAMTFINDGALNYKFFITKDFGTNEFETKKETRAKAWRNKNKNNRN